MSGIGQTTKSISGLSINGIDGSPFVMEYAVFSLGRNTETIRWPEDGWISGTVSDIADLCEAIAIPQYMLTDITQEIATGIHGVAYDLQRELPKHVSRSIADSIGQKDILQGLRLTMLHMDGNTTYLRFVGTTDRNEETWTHDNRPITTQERAQRQTPNPTCQRAVDIVLKYNYRSVVAPAVLTVVDTLPLGTASEFMGHFGEPSRTSQRRQPRRTRRLHQSTLPRDA